MKAPSRIILALAVALLPLSSHAQQYFTNVSVRRVVKLRALPGKTKEFYSYLNSIQKVFEAYEKEAGLISGLRLHAQRQLRRFPTNMTSCSFSTTRTWPPSIRLPTRAAPVIAKAYGTPENRAAVGKLGDESAETVSSELVREIKLKP